MTLGIAIIVPLSLLIYSNSRISYVKAGLGSKVTEAKETLRAETAKLGIELRAETAKLGTELRSEMKAYRSEMELLRRDMNAGFTRIETALQIHVLEHHK